MKGICRLFMPCEASNITLVLETQVAIAIEWASAASLSYTFCSIAEKNDG